ncbi:MAG: SDR family oxidoreductase [Rhizobiales bacterium]|nr:SDR family oxidoreductase [Hyphomicrobiales bacterium]OJU37924.1 MAG: NAD(P)-dependent oxidoreductase [Rhizobiales bacterium 68-8]
MRLKELKVLVTAAGAGIGKETAIAMSREGAHVLATDIVAASLRDLEGVCTATALLDVTDRAAVEAIVRRHGPFQVLVNCAGHVHDGSILDVTDADYDKSFDVNVRGMFHTIKAALPGMLEGGGGSIINIASVASSIHGVPRRCAYAATKGAVIALSKAVAADFVGKGVRCNAICPGTIETPSLQGRINSQSDAVKARAEFIARQPMGRLGRPEEIASLAVYLASPESAFTTGATHIIDGGWIM